MSEMNEKQPTVKAQARTEAQRERILNAAQKCFVESGFHAASMATIAETADMSPGLIYRYFKSKSEIILAIIERQLELVRVDLAALDGATDIPGSVTEKYGGVDQHGVSAALFLEMSAEATRDPQIASAVSTFDTTLRADIRGWLSRDKALGGRGLPYDSTETRALMLQCLIEGVRVRETREPGLDRAVLKAGLEEFLPKLLES